MNLSSQISLLVFISRFNPKLWPIIYPGFPLITNDTRNLMAAVAINLISSKITDSNTRMELESIGKSLYEKYFDENQNTGNSLDDLYQKAEWNLIYKGSTLEDLLKSYLKVVFAAEASDGQQLFNPTQGYYGALVTLSADIVSEETMMKNHLLNIGYKLMETE